MKSSLFISALSILVAACFAPASALGQEFKIQFRIPSADDQSVRPVEGRRIPASQRLRNGQTPYIHEGSNGAVRRHDEVSSNVMSLHFIRKRDKITLRAGHSLAPNLTRIATKK